jgi:hypothetical protein
VKKSRRHTVYAKRAKPAIVAAGHKKNKYQKKQNARRDGFKNSQDFLVLHLQSDQGQTMVDSTVSSNGGTAGR